MNEQESFLQKMVTQQMALIEQQQATINRLVKVLTGEEESATEEGEPQSLNRRPS